MHLPQTRPGIGNGANSAYHSARTDKDQLDGRHALVSVEILRATGSWAGEAVETFLLAPGAERITYSLAAGKDAGASVEVKATEVLLPAARIESRLWWSRLACLRESQSGMAPVLTWGRGEGRGARGEG